MNATQPETPEEHLARAAFLAGVATETSDAGWAPQALAYATAAQAHVGIAQVMTAREALAAAHAPVGPEDVPGAALARIQAALAQTPP
jgi:hypothetical protein